MIAALVGTTTVGCLTGDWSGEAQTSQDASELLTTNLVGAWSFDEASGVLVMDSSGQANDGRLAAGATRITHDAWGGALDLDPDTGVGWVRVPSSPSLNTIKRGVTIAAWVRLDAEPTGWSTVLSRQKGSSWREHYGLYLQDGRVLRFVNSSGGWIEGPPVPLGQWVHVAGSFDATTGFVKLYQNGALVASGSLKGKLKADRTPVFLGANVNEASHERTQEHLPGALDEVRLYAAVLADADVAALSVATCPTGTKQCGSACIPELGCCSDDDCPAATYTQECVQNVCQSSVCADLVSNDCAAPQTCDLESLSPRSACRDITVPGAQGASCAAQSECGATLTCLGFVDTPTGAAYGCERFCSTDAQCTGAGSICLPRVGGASTCTASCTPLDNAGCAAGATCHALSDAGRAHTGCMPPTAVAGAEGAACAGPRDCALGLTCPLPTDGSALVCRALCSVTTQAGCAAGQTCNAFQVPFVVAGVEYGTCFATQVSALAHTGPATGPARGSPPSAAEGDAVSAP